MNQQPILLHGAPIVGSGNLPVQTPSLFVGRERDIETVHLALKAGTAVLLHGPTGIGKTALVAALAAGYAELPGGVLWLDALDDTLRALVTRVARAYGVRPPAFDEDLDKPIAAVRHLLQENRPLVVLDGPMRVEDARTFARECAVGVPLLLTAETMLPGPWTPHALHALSAEDAQALLLHHAEDALQGEQDAVEAFVEALGGHPFSIEVAARQLAVGHVAPQALLERMPSLPPGHKNRAMSVLLATYRLLPTELQGMVMLLGTAFAGGASQELLCDVSGARPDVLLERMRRLVRHGLAAERVVYEQPYFTAHVLVREFAQAFLRSKKRLNIMYTRYLQGLPAYIRRYVAENDDFHHDRLASEMANVLAASLYAAQQGRVDFVQEVARLLTPTEERRFAVARRFEPEIQWLHYLSEHPQAASEGVLGRAATEAPATAAAEPAPQPPAEAPPEQPEPEPQAPSEPRPARPPLRAPKAEAVPLAERERAQPSPAPRVEAPTGAPEEAEEPPTAPEPTVQAEADDTPPPANVERLEKLSAEVAKVGAPKEQLAQYSEVLDDVHADGDVEDELAALEALAKVHLQGEQYAEVLAQLERGLALAQEVENPKREGEMLVILGDLQMVLHRLDGAEVAYREAISAFRPVEAWLNIARTLEKLGMVYLRMRRPQDALAAWEQAEPIFEHEGRHNELRRLYNRLGGAHMRLLQWERAQHFFERALELAEQLEDTRALFVQHSKLADLMEARGNISEAVLSYRRALHYAYALEDSELIALTLLALGRLLINDTAQLNRALQVLEEADALLPDESEIQRLLGRARTRHERLTRAGVTLPPAEGSLQAYAQAALEGPPNSAPEAAADQ